MTAPSLSASRMIRSLIVRDGAGDRRPATRQATSATVRPAIDVVRVNNRLRGVIRGALGALRPRSAPRSTSASRPRVGVFKTPAIKNMPLLKKASNREGWAGSCPAHAEAWRPRSVLSDKAERLAGIAGARRSRATPEVRAMLLQLSHARTSIRSRARPPARRSRRSTRKLASLRIAADGLPGAEPRLRAAAGRDRPRHHLRRHGRHQHGAWRNGDDRRLHHVRRPAGPQDDVAGRHGLLRADRDPGAPSWWPARSAWRSSAG